MNRKDDHVILVRMYFHVKFKSAHLATTGGFFFDSTLSVYENNCAIFTAPKCPVIAILAIRMCRQSFPAGS